MILQKIISGAQTGADRGGLDFALKHEIPHGGWVPKGRLAEDGPVPAIYNVTEHDSPKYPPRTEANVRDSDATVLFTYGPADHEPGSKLTVHCCRKWGKYVLAVDLSKATLDEAGRHLRKFCVEEEIKILNVAGNRESKAPGIGGKVQRVLEIAFVEI